MLKYITVKKNTLSDADSIQSAVNLAFDTNVSTVVIESGVYNIDKTILLPDFMRVIIDGASLYWKGDINGKIFSNSNAFNSYSKLLVAEQYGISIIGDNNAQIFGASILFHNVRNCRIENLSFHNSDFGVVITSAIGVKLKNLSFSDCNNGICFGVGANDCFVNDIFGSVSDKLFAFGNNFFPELKKDYHPLEVKNIILRNIQATADYISFISGNATQKIIFNDLVSIANKFAFFFENDSFKHIIVNNAKIDGALSNIDLPNVHFSVY